MYIDIIKCHKLWVLKPERLGESTESGPLCTTDLFMNKSISLFFAYSKPPRIFRLSDGPVYYVTFQCGRKNIFRKILNIFFAHKKLKKTPQKVAYLWQLGVCFLCSPACPKQPRTSFPSLLESLPEVKQKKKYYFL